jgi:hypothetical protein
MGEWRGWIGNPGLNIVGRMDWEMGGWRTSNHYTLQKPKR